MFQVFCAKKDRNPLIDIVKGIGILCVVYGHSKIDFGHYMIYMFHMPLFFFVSGYLHKERKIKSLLLMKANSLIKPYIVFYTICKIIDYLFEGSNMVHKIDIFYPNGSAGSLWFLLALFEVSILFQITLTFAKRYIGLICCVLAISAYILSQYHISLPLFIDSSMSMMLFYYIGFLMKKFKPEKNYIFKYPLYLITSFILLYILDYKVMHLKINDIWSNQIMGNFALFILSALVGIAMIFSVSRLLMQTCPLLKEIVRTLGYTSLYIFALHMPILNICFYIEEVAHNNFYKLIYCLMAIVGSYIIGHLLLKFRLL